MKTFFKNYYDFIYDFLGVFVILWILEILFCILLANLSFIVAKIIYFTLCFLASFVIVMFLYRRYGIIQ